jgi:hypothetical protein
MTMECRECDSIIHDFMHAKLGNEDARAKAFEHMMDCARCEIRFSNVRSLERALRALAETMDSERSAARLEPALRIAFQKEKRERQRSRSVAGWVAVGIAASLLLSIGVLSRHWVFGPERKPPTVATSAAVQPDDAANARTPKTAAKEALEARNHRKSNSRVPAKRTDSQELMTGFYELSYAESSDHMMSGEIVRVTLRGSVLPGIGFPVALDGDRAAEQITADLLVGENGLPLAIRFVR